MHTASIPGGVDVTICLYASGPSRWNVLNVVVGGMMSFIFFIHSVLGIQQKALNKRWQTSNILIVFYILIRIMSFVINP